ncbi:unnamed protein product [Gulo gulo]|uniref:Uncharacterized protein n=1 Tax=Gulo gulo TaxID=48420 RepID=A0A9X9LX28_GULGU|nr:unnamed protein product [Gulo gulo]
MDWMGAWMEGWTDGRTDGRMMLVALVPVTVLIPCDGTLYFSSVPISRLYPVFYISPGGSIVTPYFRLPPLQESSSPDHTPQLHPLDQLCMLNGHPSCHLSALTSEPLVFPREVPGLLTQLFSTYGMFVLLPSEQVNSSQR